MPRRFGERPLGLFLRHAAITMGGGPVTEMRHMLVNLDDYRRYRGIRSWMSEQSPTLHEGSLAWESPLERRLADIWWHGVTQFLRYYVLPIATEKGDPQYVRRTVINRRGYSEVRLERTDPKDGRSGIVSAQGDKLFLEYKDPHSNHRPEEYGPLLHVQYTLFFNSVQWPQSEATQRYIDGHMERSGIAETDDFAFMMWENLLTIDPGAFPDLFSALWHDER